MPQIALDEKTLKWLPWLVAMSFFMQMLDGTILNTALPSIAHSFNADPLRVQSVLIAYMLTVAIFIPASGWLADRFGPKKLMAFSIGIFTLGSLLCAVAPSLFFLIGARIIQAVGGALMVPVGRLVILRAFPRAQLVQLLSFITMPGLVGSLAGPAVGGLLVEYATWHWIFLINLPIGLAGIAMTLKLMPNFKNMAKTPFDKSGFLVFALSLVAISMALEGIGDLGFHRYLVSALFIFGILGQLFYWLILAGKKNPLFVRDLFKSVGFSIGLAGNLLTRLGTGATPFLIPLFLQVVLGYSAITAGLLMMPMAFASLLAKMVAKPLTARFGFRLILIVNTFLQGLFVLSLSLVSLQMNTVIFVVQLSLLGSVNALQFSVLNAYTLLDVVDEYASSGNALLSVVMQISQSLAVGVAAAVLFAFTGSHAAPAAGDINLVLKAFQATFQVIGLVSICSTILFLFIPKKIRKSYNCSMSNK